MTEDRNFPVTKCPGSEQSRDLNVKGSISRDPNDQGPKCQRTEISRDRHVPGLKRPRSKMSRGRPFQGLISDSFKKRSLFWSENFKNFVSGF